MEFGVIWMAESQKNQTNEVMNKELEDWIKESHIEPEKVHQDEEGLKKPEGNCEICGKNKSTVICLKCSRSICSSCYYKIIGICKSCISKEVMEKWEGKTPDWGEILGVQWVD